MSRRRSRGPQRDASDIANLPTLDVIDELLRPVALPEVPVDRFDEFLGDALPFDRRQFSFHEPERYSLKSGDRSHRSAAVFSPEPTVAFGDRSTVAICHRRQARREVLFAKKRMRGRGGARRRSWRSDVKC